MTAHLALIAALGLAIPLHAQTVKLGAATVALQPKGIDAKVPEAPFRTDAQKKLAAPTDQ